MTAATSSGQLTIYDRVADLPPIWDNVAESDMLSLNRRLLQVLEEFSTNGHKRRYIVFRSPSGTVIATGELLQPPCNHNPVVDILLGRLYHRIPAAHDWLLPMLLLRADLGRDIPIMAAAKPGTDRVRLLRSMLKALQLHATHQDWALAVTGIPAADTTLVNVLTRAGYLKTLARPVAELRLNFGSWDAYVESAAQHNKKAAATIRQETNRAQREGVTIEEWDSSKVPESHLHKLLNEHQRRLTRQDFCYKPGILSALKCTLGDKIRILLAIHENRIMGVSVFTWAGSRGYTPYIGMVEKAERAGLAYFSLAYYQPIRLAIDLGLKNLAYGNAVFPAKIRRGCTATETCLFFRPRRGVIRAILKGPMSLHQRLLQNKYAAILQAPAFSSLR